MYYFEKLEAKDLSFFKEMLYLAIYVAEDEKKPPKSLLEQPALRIYYEHWGKEGDEGIIVRTNDEKLGAIWCRLFAANEKGYGYVDEHTPEMGIAIREDWRNRGLGSKLIDLMVETLRKKGLQQLSLSVDKRNPAIELYRRKGFRTVKIDGHSFTMLKKI